MAFLPTELAGLIFDYVPFDKLQLLADADPYVLPVRVLRYLLRFKYQIPMVIIQGQFDAKISAAHPTLTPFEYYSNIVMLAGHVGYHATAFLPLDIALVYAIQNDDNAMFITYLPQVVQAGSTVTLLHNRAGMNNERFAAYLYSLAKQHGNSEMMNVIKKTWVFTPFLQLAHQEQPLFPGMAVMEPDLHYALVSLDVDSIRQFLPRFRNEEFPPFDFTTTLDFIRHISQSTDTSKGVLRAELRPVMQQMYDLVQINFPNAKNY